jgi:hypothetical protein
LCGKPAHLESIGLSLLSCFGRRVSVGRYVYDRRLIPGGCVAICRERSGHRVFRRWRRGRREFRLVRVSSGRWTRHESEARPVLGGSNDRAGSSARRRGSAEPAEWHRETESGRNFVARQRHSRRRNRRQIAKHPRRSACRREPPTGRHRQPANRCRRAQTREAAQARDTAQASADWPQRSPGSRPRRAGCVGCGRGCEANIHRAANEGTERGAQHCGHHRQAHPPWHRAV